MLKFFAWIIFLLSFCTTLRSQTYAIYIDAPNAALPVNHKIYDDVLNGLKNKLKIDGWAFTLNEEGLIPDTSFRSAENEAAADMLISVFFSMYEEYDLDLKFTQDTNKKVIGAYFSLGTVTRYRIILTDLHTDEMLRYNTKYSQNAEEQQKGKKLVLTDDEFQKYFGPLGPVVLQNKSKVEYDRALLKIKAAFKPRIEAYYMENRPDILSLVTNQLRANENKSPIKIEHPVVENGKLKSFQIPAPTGFPYYEGMYVTVFTLDTLGEFIYPENFKWWIVDQVGAKTCTAESKFLIPSDNKGAGDAIDAGKTLYFLPGSAPYAEYKKVENEITVDARGKELHGIENVYLFLTRSPQLRVINSVEEELLQKFHERYKGGRFVDSGYNLASLGAKLIVTSSDVDFVIQDAQSGTVFGSCPKNYGAKGIYDLFQKTLDLKIRIIKPLDGKKDVLKSALVYSPMGFYDDFSFDIMLITPETVNGRTLYRESEIGRGNMWNEEKYGYIFGEAKFNKGEKEIGAAYANKQDLLFVSHEFKFPFIGKFK